MAVQGTYVRSGLNALFLIIWLVSGLSATLSVGSELSAYERLDDATAQNSHSNGDSVIDVIQRRGLMKIGISLFEPWVMCGVEGDLIGYEVDVAKKLASDMSVRIRFVRTDWYFIIPDLIEEKFDLIISGMGITPSRGLLVNFSIPAAEFGTLVVVNTNLIEDAQSLDELNVSEVTIGARAGTVPAQVASDHFPLATLRLFDSDPDLLAELIAGDLHAAAADQVKATHWLDTHPNILYSPFDLLNKVPEAIALRKGDLDGLNYLNSWIEHHESNGWLSEKRNYWFDTREWEDLVATDPTAVENCVESFVSD